MGSNDEAVLEKVCAEKHKAIDDKLKATDTRLNDHSNRLGSVEDAIIRLTAMMDEIKKKDFYDKILILCVFIMVIVVAAMVLGPDITKRIMGV